MGGGTIRTASKTTVLSGSWSAMARRTSIPRSDLAKEDITIAPPRYRCSIKEREFEYTPTNAYTKAMEARALSQLTKGNPAICKSITESRAPRCFATLLKKRMEDVQYNSAFALMEIACVTEQDAELRQSLWGGNEQ